ncbi:MAG: type III PLP-dependent enzyme [Alphaproteobacteria bacterium]|nr:type III PLP-dependent enzyme [Alphaproteobacteria bacterium]
MTEKIRRFLRDRQPATPCVVVDLDVVGANYDRLHRLLPRAEIYYAVKANPAAPVVKLLVGKGSCFDTASIHEIDLCLGQGAPAERLSFGNTIKKQSDIAAAFARGVTLFAFDSRAELEKLAVAAPGARVFCRVLMDCPGAEWPLNRKFGCELEMARDLMIRARGLGLDPYGLSFHVGSQQTDLDQWDLAIGRTAMVFSMLNEAGIELRMLNIGGGFPAHYRRDNVPELDAYADAINRAMEKHFGNRMPQLIIEPGRGMTGDAGVIQTEVVLISEKGYGETRRWVFLDIGKFGGLAETMDESIQYRIRTRHDGTETGPVILAGPTCDSADVLYDKADYRLPLALRIGDKIEIHATGAYTTSYSAVGFNGFPPLQEHYI